jgi:hypothetical protein
LGGSINNYEVDDIVGTIAVAADEQTSTTREIADVNESASEISNSSAQAHGD